MTNEELIRHQAAILQKGTRLVFFQSAALLLSAVALVAAVYLSATKRPEVLAVTPTGAVIPLVPLDKPMLSDSRIVGFSDECVRAAFSHDFLNHRKTVSDAAYCFTDTGNAAFVAALAPLIKDIEERRLVMSPTLRPAVIVQSGKRGGVHQWVVQVGMRLFREGTSTRVDPADYVVELTLLRVPLEENVRGVGIAQITARPGARQGA